MKKWIGEVKWWLSLAAIVATVVVVVIMMALATWVEHRNLKVKGAKVERKA